MVGKALPAGKVGSECAGVLAPIVLVLEGGGINGKFRPGLVLITEFEGNTGRLALLLVSAVDSLGNCGRSVSVVVPEISGENHGTCEPVSVLAIGGGRTGMTIFVINEEKIDLVGDMIGTTTIVDEAGERENQGGELVRIMSDDGKNALELNDIQTVETEFIALLEENCKLTVAVDDEALRESAAPLLVLAMGDTNVADRSVDIADVAVAELAVVGTFRSFDVALVGFNPRSGLRFELEAGALVELSWPTSELAVGSLKLVTDIEPTVNVGDIGIKTGAVIGTVCLTFEPNKGALELKTDVESCGGLGDKESIKEELVSPIDTIADVLEGLFDPVLVGLVLPEVNGATLDAVEVSQPCGPVVGTPE